MKNVFALCLLLSLSVPASAQFRVGSGVPGTGGQGTGGLGTGGVGTGGNSGFGRTGQTGGQTGAGGQTGTGGGGLGSGFSFDPGFGTSAFANPFRNSGNNVGMNRMGMMGMGGMGMGGMGFGGMGMGGMGMGRFGMGGMGSQQQQQSKFRPTVQLGFEVVGPSPQQRAQQAQFTLARLPQSQRFTGVTVQMEGSRAVVSGKLKEPKDAELLRQLLLLEPGVYQVDLQQLDSATEQNSPSNRSDSSARSLPPSVTAELVPAPQQ